MMMVKQKKNITITTEWKVIYTRGGWRELD